MRLKAIGCFEFYENNLIHTKINARLCNRFPKIVDWHGKLFLDNQTSRLQFFGKPTLTYDFPMATAKHIVYPKCRPDYLFGNINVYKIHIKFLIRKSVPIRNP